MKKLLFFTLLTLLVAAMWLVPATASDNVVYLADGGEGDGSSASAPVATAEAAYAALGDEGGTIVICGTYTVGNTSTIQMPTHTGTVTITSVYGDVDYREGGATLSFNGTSFAAFNGPTVFDGITMSIVKTAAGICMNFNDLTIGYDVEIVKTGGTGYYMYLIGGPNNNASISPLAAGETFNMSIYSGKYHTMSGFSRSNANASHEGTAIVTLGGTADVSAFCGGPLSTGAKGGTSIVNLEEDASITTFYLGGYNCGAMNGDITVNISGNASITTITNYSETYFATTKRNLNITGSATTLPAGYADMFDNITADGITIKPASDNKVIYVADGGSGDGLNEAVPISSLELAYSVLSDEGGEIVLVGDTTVSSALALSEKGGDITFSAKNSAKLILSADIALANNTNGAGVIFDLPVSATDAAIFGSFRNVTFGENFTVDGTLDFFGGIDTTALESDTTAITEIAYTITVKGGTFANFSGGNYRSDYKSPLGSIAAPLTVNISGGTFTESFSLSGMSILADGATLTVSDGTFGCALYAQGAKGPVGAPATRYSATVDSDRKYYAADGDITIDISGGTFNGGLIGASENEVSYSQVLRGNYTVSIIGGTFADGTVIDATQVKAYKDSENTASLTYADGYTFTANRFDYVNGETMTYDEPLRVAFVGDSITEGPRPDIHINSFPAVFASVAEENEKEVIVSNYGIASSGILTTTSVYYHDRLAYPMVMEETDADYIFVAMGTNDNAAGLDNYLQNSFEDNFTSFISGFGALPETDKVFVSTALPRVNENNYHIRVSSVVRPIQEKVAQEFAAQDANKYIYVDLYGLTLPEAAKGSFFSSDNLHPSVSGYATMGELVYNAVFNGTGPSEYKMTDIYLGENGTHYGTGTSDDSSSRIDLAITYAPLGEEVTLHVSGTVSYNANIHTPLGVTKFNIVGEGEGAVLEMTGGTLFKAYSDIKLDNITLKTTVADSYIIGAYNNIEFTETAKLEGDWSFAAGYAVYSRDTEETASCTDDCTITLNASGTLTNFMLGNKRIDDTALFGTYSGSLSATVGANITVSGTEFIGAVGQNYLTGAIDVTMNNGSSLGEYTATGTVSSPATYDSTKNTGTITVTANEAVYSNVIFVMNGGEGDGTKASTPLGSLADAYAKLESSGTIVICGTYTVGNTSNVTLPANTSEIKITSVFGGVDYRSTNSAALVFDGTSFLKLSGPTVFDAVTMSLDKTAAGICANFNPITITESVNIIQAAGGTGYYMYLVVGTNGDTVNTLDEGEVLEINVNGGKFINLTGFSRSVAATNLGTVVLNIGGSADVRDLSAGSLSSGSYAGNAIVNLSGNASVTTLYLGGYNSGGMKGDAVVNITDSASIGAVKNYSATYFPESERYINIYSENVTLQSDYANCFDNVTTVSDNANVKFVMSGAIGDGTSPFTPAGTIEAAYAALANGGTVVIMDDVNFANTSTLQLASHEGTITLTSLYGGIDYRTLKDAKVGFDGTSFVCFNGNSVIDNITLNIDKSSEGFCFNFNDATIGEGFEIIEPDGYHMIVLAGANNNTDIPALAEGEEVTLTILSGKYHTVSGFTRQMTDISHEGTVTINIGGDALIDAYCVGPISTGAKGGNAIVNMYDTAVVNKMYLGGYNCGAMNGGVTVNIDNTAVIGSFLNYDETFFPSSTKTLNILSVDTSLPSNYPEVFDTVTTVNKKLTVALTLPEGAPSSDKLTHLLIDGKTVPYTMSEADGVITVEFESVLDSVNVSLTYKDTSYQRIAYTVAIADGVATATLAENKTYDGSVIYIADGGTGDGLTAASPLATFADAYAMLTDGGTIVVSGEITMAKCTAPAHGGAVTITSVYDGVDYRESGARLYYPATSTLILGGETVFKDLTIDLDVNGLISAAFNPVVFDTGIVINYDCSEEDANGLYLVGGYNTGAIPENADYSKNSSITLRSGSFSRVFGFSRYVGAQEQSGTASIILENDAYVRYLIAGATGNSATSNNANIKISDNVIVETLYLGGLNKDNYMYGETLVDITDISGGTIYEFDGISLYAMVNGTDTIHYDPRTVPDGVLHLASLAWVDNILTLCDVAGSHTFGDAYASPFDETMQIHTCTSCGLTSSLEEVSGGGVDGVVYVADGGFGDGSSPATPLGSYADAFDALGDKGGTIVVIGECTLSKNMKYKHGSDPEFYQEPMHSGEVLVTSVYGDIDYRESGAKLIFDGKMDYKLSGPVTFDNIDFDTTDVAAENTIAARYNKLKFGDGVKMLKTYAADGYKLNVVGGYKYFRYTDFAGVEIEDEWLRLLNHAVRTNTIELPDSGTLNIGGTTPRAETADAFNALWAEMEANGMQLPIVSSSMQTYEWKHDFFANFLGNTRVNHPDWTYERAHTYVTKSCGEPGGSEHHLGVAVDMYDNTIDSDTPNHDYNTTAEWDWLVNEGNAARYGIILRYPANEYCSLVTGTIPEAWHFRYIGVEHAKAYTEGNYPIFEFYVGDKIGLFAKDSSVSVNGGAFYSISGGSAECTDITFTGSNIVSVASDVVVESVTDVTSVMGDATGDGKTTLLDVVRLMKYVANGEVEINSINSDMNSDGSVNIADVLLVLDLILN